MSDLREGGCQCGAVRYRVEGSPIAVGICHCTECQRQSGSAFGIYNEPRYMDGVLTVKPGTFDDTSLLRPNVQVWN